MKDRQTMVLEFEAVTYRSPSDAYASFEGASFGLRFGELVGVRIDRDSEHVPVADLATGLLPPDAGTILYCGKDWQGMHAFGQSAARGRIGCVLESKSWISSLTVKQNLLLRERHHTSRKDEDILRDAETLVHQIGLSDIPEGRPDMVRPRELRMLEWVRAFLGSPDLVVLMFPERDTFSGACSVCMELVDRARQDGTAVLWVSDRHEVWQQPQMKEAKQYEISNDQWLLGRREMK